MPSFLAVLFFLLLIALWFRYSNQKKHTEKVLQEKESLVQELSGLLGNKEELTKENRYLKSLFDKGPGFVIGISSAGNILFVNQETTRFSRIPEPSGRHYWEMIRDDKLNRLIAQALQDKQFREEKIDFLIENKSFSISFYPDKDGLFLIGRDLTREQQLAWQRREFTANASHELRSPITILNTALETMRRFLSKEGENFYEIAIRQVGRLSALAKDLLTLAEAENELLPDKFEEVNLTEFANNFLPNFFQEAQKKGIQMSVAIPEGLPGVKADKHRLEQVFGNLLDNAFKYTPSGGQVEINGSLFGNVARPFQGRQREVLLKISDTGIGIPPEDLPRIFERFYRVDKGRSRQLGGTGLGLSIVRHIVEEAGGKVWVESEVDKGSVVFFTLPVWR